MQSLMQESENSTNHRGRIKTDTALIFDVPETVLGLKMTNQILRSMPERITVPMTSKMCDHVNGHNYASSTVLQQHILLETSCYDAGMACGVSDIPVSTRGEHEAK